VEKVFQLKNPGFIIRNAHQMSENKTLNKKKIILLGPYPPPYGGVATFNQTLSSHLKPYNALIWAHSSAPPNETNIRHFNQSILKIIQILIQDGRRATILDSSVFLLDWPNKAFILILFLIKPFLKCRWIKMVHSGTLPSRFSRFSFTQNLFFRLATSLIDEYITVNEELNHWLTNTLDKREKISTIPSLLPPPPDFFSGSLPPQIKEGLASYSKIIVSIGLFLPNYGFKQTIEALEALRNNKKLNIGLVLIEGTSAIDPEYKNAVLENRDWIKVYTDIPQPQVLQFLQLADAYVRATLEESYGLSKIEALWSGTPVVSTPQGETRGMTLFDRDNPEEMAQAIEGVLSKPNHKELQETAELFKREAWGNLNSYLMHLGLDHE